MPSTSPTRPEPDADPIAAIAPHARAVATAWVAAGASACSLRDPAGGHVPLAGDLAAVPTAWVPLDGVLRGWTLTVASDIAVDRVRLAADASLLTTLAQRSHELNETTTALVDTNDQLLALYDLAASPATTLSSAELAAVLAEDTRRLAGAASVAIELADGTVVAVGDGIAADHLRSTPAGGIDRLLRAGVGPDGVDVVVRGICGGGRVAIGSTAHRRFPTPQLKLIDAVVDHVSGLLALASMHEAAIADAVLRRDAETAAALARLVLPTEPPRIAGLDVAGRCDPARLAAGDFYTWVETGSGLVVAAGDVAGKGLGAALVMTMVMGATARAAHTGGDPGRILAEIDRELAAYLDDAAVFVTMAVAVHRPGDDVVRVANAGHSPVLARNDGRATMVRPGGPPLGVLDDPVYDVVELPWRGDDLLVIGTDGLAEQTDPEGRQHGYERIVAVVERSAAETAHASVDELFASVERFSAGAPQADDRTALVLRRATEVPG